MAKVSLIVPIYNSQNYLEKCIKSLLNQTLKDIQIILINDGSTDGSEKIIKSFDDERIVYISKNNEGIGKTRNLGIDKATGEFLAFVDSDDYLNEHFCEYMYQKAVNDDCDLVVCDFFENRNTLVGIKFKDFKDTNLRETPELINNINLGPCNKLYKKSLFDDKSNRFEENLKYEDAPFVVKMLLSANKIGKVNDYLTYYVIHSNSETTIRDKRMYDILEITDIIVNDLKKVDYPNDSLVSLAVMILTDYTIQQRYISDVKYRHDFINKAFKYLNNLDRKWRRCSYLKRFPSLKRYVKTSKLLTKIYCDLYNLRHK
ncbi:MAG: glycosyltransferase [Tenericutes bacterium]|nr:glycosyltransferase [Mycoplasmatota bacterium]